MSMLPTVSTNCSRPATGQAAGSVVAQGFAGTGTDQALDAAMRHKGLRINKTTAFRRRPSDRTCAGLASQLGGANS